MESASQLTEGRESVAEPVFKPDSDNQECAAPRAHKNRRRGKGKRERNDASLQEAHTEEPSTSLISAIDSSETKEHENTDAAKHIREEKRRRRKRSHKLNSFSIQTDQDEENRGNADAESPGKANPWAQWSMGLVLPLHNFTGLDSPSSARYNSFMTNYDESLIWDPTLMRIVENAAHDPLSIESLVKNLASALPEISQEAKQNRDSDHVTSPALDHSYISEIETVYEENAPLSRDPFFSGDDEAVLFPIPVRERKSTRIWGSTSSLASLSREVAAYAVDDQTQSREHVPIWYEWDPEREYRVSLVTEMAEEERRRRISESEASRWRDRIDRAAQIEWAVLAMKQRNGISKPIGLSFSSQLPAAASASSDQVQEYTTVAVSSTYEPSPLNDYEVICPYSVLGCDVTLPRSELPKHLEECSCKAEVMEARRLARLREEYNPLDHIVICPYSVLGCDYSCRRADLPAHLALCPFKAERQNSAMMVYEVVCPNATLGCNVTCLRSQISVHLQECKFRSRSQQEEEAERASNKVYAIEAEEEERSRRLSSLQLESGLDNQRGDVQLGAESNEQEIPNRGQRRRSALEFLHDQISTSGSLGRMKLRHVEKHVRQSSAPEASWKRENPLPSVLNAERLKWNSSRGSREARLSKSERIEVRGHEKQEVSSDEQGNKHTYSTLQSQQAWSDSHALGRSATSVLPIASLHNYSNDASGGVRLARSASLSLPLERQETGSDDEFMRTRRVSWIVQAAEIERMRMVEEERIAKSIKSPQSLPVPQATSSSQSIGKAVPSVRSPPLSPQRSRPNTHLSSESSGTTPASPLRSRKVRSLQKTDDDDSESPPGRRRVILEQVLRRQKLHHADWYPAGELAFEGRRTHVHMFHTHMEQQTRLLHKALSDEIESFGRDCALWQMESQAYVTSLVDKTREMIIKAWVKFISKSPPSVHLFGSFASELSVPGISDLDLVVVPGEDLPIAQESVTLPDIPSLKNDTVTEGALPSPVSSEASSNTRTTKPARSASVDSTSQSLLGKIRQRATPPKDGSSDEYIRSLMRDRLEAARRCRILGEALRECDFLRNIKIIDTALVPLISMETTEEETGFKFDIDLTVALSNHDGLAAAEFVRILRLRFPPLMPMVRLLKAYLHSRNLANPFHGGLPSYALVLMATCSIMRSCERVGPRQAASISQGELILDFLNLYGRDFDYKNEAVCCNWRADLDKLRMGGVYSPSEPPLLRIAPRVQSLSGNNEVSLVVDDPIRFGNNVGRSCFAFHHVQAAFAEVLASLLQHVVKNEALSRSKTGFGGSSSLLEHVFGVQPLRQRQKQRVLHH